MAQSQATPSSTEPSTSPSALASADWQIIERLLRNEADPAFRRRAIYMLSALDLHDGELVLDGGCGYGFYTLAMRRLRQITVVALELDRQRLQQACFSSPAAHGAGGNLLDLPFNDHSFDKVLISEVLEHIADDAQVLREVYRVLRPGGIVVLSVPHANYPVWWDPINWLGTALGLPPLRHTTFGGIWEGHIRLYEPALLQEQIAAAGFMLESCVEATHYALPCTPYLVYGLGKPLIERNLLPVAWRRYADRMQGWNNPGRHPFNALRRIMYSLEQLNERDSWGPGTSFVNILVKARKGSG